MKKNLIVLLLIPFIIALLGIVTINVTFNLIDNDILSIKWDYQDNEAFQINKKYLLKAEGISDSKYPVSAGNELVWSLVNKDSEDKEIHAEIVTEGRDVYLSTRSEGEIIITCSNKKETIFKTMNALIYEHGAILVNPLISGSQNNIDSTIYYGEYDLVNNKKENAEVAYSIRVIPDALTSDLVIDSISDNISFDIKKGVLKINKEGPASVVFKVPTNETIQPYSLSFEVVDNGVNVYSYDDLLACTNKSLEGEIVVLRKSFESREYLEFQTFNNAVIFGKYSESSKTYSFKDEVYRFETNFNKEYIKQWNKFTETNKDYKRISSEVLAGLHVQKDFYGNGYTLNLHNLTYPYGTLEINNNGTIVIVPDLKNENLFRGPLSFITLGDPNNVPLIGAYGQDNIGMYVDGDNIVINDVNLKNCDFGNSLSNLDLTGTVLEVSGNNNTIKNSRISNGKHVIRSFSSMDLKIDNCMLSNARNFLFTTGSNEYVPINGNEIKSFTNHKGQITSAPIKEFLAEDGSGDQLLNDFMNGQYDDNDAMKKALISIQEAINDPEDVEDQYKGSTSINDTLFYQSGIASIALETYFNGPYLYSSAPSMINDLFSSMNYEDRPLVPLNTKNLSGTSYPVRVSLEGKTKFYDYKKTDAIDLNGLIRENISTIANSIFSEENIRKITIDDIFPLKSMLVSKANQQSCVYSYTKDEETSRYINIPIAYYGGGLNLSNVDTTNLENSEVLSNKIPVNLIDSYITLDTDDESLIRVMKNLMLKAVVTVIGCEEFRFICYKNSGYLFNETPSVSELRNNVKGAN